MNITPARRIPMVLKLAYTAFVAVMVPYYWRTYGPQNFLYFCDVAVLVTLVGIWLESALLVSIEAVAILLPQTLWLLDFIAHLLGFKVTGMTDYMFASQYPLFVRGLSLFHGWLPILIIYLVYRLGYDRRAIWLQTLAGIGLLLVCYFGFAPPGHAEPGKMMFNINYVFGMSETTTQTRFRPLVWLGILIVGIPTLLYLPAHLLLSWLFGKTDVVDEAIVPIINSTLCP